MKQQESVISYSFWGDISTLIKFKLNLTVVFSSVMSYLILRTDSINYMHLLWLTLGGFLVTSGANAINQALERDYDILMTRTMNRPVAQGRMSLSMATLLSGILCLLGVSLLSFLGIWPAFLGLAAFVIYAFVYTPVKRYSTLAIPIGAIPGALPVLIAGVVADDGRFTIAALSLFAIQYLWQFPHFWAIGWLGHQDYIKAGFKLIKEKDGQVDNNTGLYGAFYALLIIPCVILLFSSLSYHIIGLVLCIALTIYYAWTGYQLYKENTRAIALKMMFASILYLPAIQIVMYISKYI